MLVGRCFALGVRAVGLAERRKGGLYLLSAKRFLLNHAAEIPSALDQVAPTRLVPVRSHTLSYPTHASLYNAHLLQPAHTLQRFSVLLAVGLAVYHLMLCITSCCASTPGAFAVASGSSGRAT